MSTTEDETMSELKPMPCGFYCSPAIDKAMGASPNVELPPCNHDETAHYSIDGENVGCTECEEIAGEDYEC